MTGLKLVVQPARPERLNLGCCDRRINGYWGVDRVPGPAVDQVVDLARPWPFESDSVRDIIAHDVIEHLPDRILTMNEIHRVLVLGGHLDLIVPSTDGRGAFQDPTHVSFWNRNSFWYFERGNPYRERFAQSYGIRAAFRVLLDDTMHTTDGPKIKLLLEKV